MIPKEGGNTFAGTVDGLYTHERTAGDHLERRIAGPRPDGDGKTDTSMHPARRWAAPQAGQAVVLLSPRLCRLTRSLVADSYCNKTQGTPFYTPDLSRPAHRYEWDTNYVGPASPGRRRRRNKISVFVDPQRYRSAGGRISPPRRKRAGHGISGRRGCIRPPGTAGHKQAAVRSRFGLTMQDWPFITQPGVTENDISLRPVDRLPVQRARPDLQRHPGRKRWTQRGSLSYITGSHAFKAGFNIEEGKRHFHTTVHQNQRWQFVGTTPSRIVQLATPYDATEKFNADSGFYAQDQWTIKRLTLNGGLRFEYFTGSVPAQDNPATPNGWVVARHFDEIKNTPSWKDLNPRFGVAYDLLGDSSTALKFSLGRYTLKHALEVQSAINPINSSVNSVSRTWNDNFYGPGDPRSGNYVPDCNLASRTADGECGAMSDPNFGGLKITTRYADDITRGFGVRDYNWDLPPKCHTSLAPRCRRRSGITATGMGTSG